MNKEIKFKRTSPGRYEAKVGSLNYLIYKLEADQRAYLANWSLLVTDYAKEGDGFIEQDWWNTKRDIMFFLKHSDPWWLKESEHKKSATDGY